MATALQTIKAVVSSIVQELPNEAHASVMVQFAAGDWAALKEAVAQEETAVESGAASDIEALKSGYEGTISDLQKELAEMKGQLASKSETLLERVEGVFHDLT